MTACHAVNPPPGRGLILQRAKISQTPAAGLRSSFLLRPFLYQYWPAAGREPYQRIAIIAIMRPNAVPYKNFRKR